MRLRFRFTLLALFCAGIPLLGQAQGFPLRVTDDTDAVVTLRAAPVRIVSLTLLMDEMLVDLVDAGRI